MDIEKLKTEVSLLEQELSSPNIFSNQEKFAEISRNHIEKSKLLDLYLAIESINIQIKESEEILETESDLEMKELVEMELEELKSKLIFKNGELNDILHPKEEVPNEIIVELRAGAGGDEASLFVAEMFKAYSNFLQNNNAKINVINVSENNVGGFKEVVFEAKAREVYNLLRYESGVHRVQRIPKTEKAGRVHTSTITVAVLAVAKEVDNIEINPNDLKIDVFRSSGPGGQSVNTTDSAVRLTHFPSGIVISCQDEKSQLKNKDKAMKILKAKLLSKQKEDAAAEEAAKRKDQVGTGDRSEKIRTYNFPQDRITDHRIKQNFSNIEGVMLGDFTKILEAFYDYKTNNPESNF